MNIFPSTETYLITWLGGSCGAFITSLVYQFVVKPVDDFAFSKFGHAHGIALDECIKNWNRIIPVVHSDLYKEKISVFSSVDPICPSQPLILYDHLIPNLDELFTKYPLCKNIVIEMDKRTVNRVQGNLFFKTLVQEFPKSVEVWKNLQNKHPYFKDYTDPKDVPIELSERYIREWGSRWPFPNIEFFMADYVIHEQYKNNLFHINVYDIIHNRDLVLETISKITNKPILPNIVKYYDAYLAKQDELVKTQMPWLDDK
jgi:hypothetical protein